MAWHGVTWGLCTQMHMRVPATRWNDEGVGLKRLRASLAALAPAAEASLGAGLETVSVAVSGRCANLGGTHPPICRSTDPILASCSVRSLRRFRRHLRWRWRRRRLGGQGRRRHGRRPDLGWS